MNAQSNAISRKPTPGTAALAAVPGLYVLRPDGELAFIEQGGQLVIDAELSRAFGRHNVEYLKAYHEAPEAPGFRLGILFRSKERKGWGQENVVLERSIVRTLFPMSGAATGGLTGFQIRNRLKSVDAAIELLLEFENQSIPDAPIFCPVLYDRGGTLGQYRAELDGHGAQDGDRTPAVEVLNLLAIVPIMRRNRPEIEALREKIREGLATERARVAETCFSLIDQAVPLRPATHKVSASPYAFAGIDKRHDRDVALKADEDVGAGYLAWVDGLWSSDTHRTMARYAMQPPACLEPRALRAFRRFQRFDADQLALLADIVPVYRAPGGAELLQRGTVDTWNLYLLEGAIELETVDGAKSRITGGSANAEYPVALLKPRIYTVRALTPVKFLWIHDAAVDDVGSNNLPSARVY